MGLNSVSTVKIYYGASRIFDPYNRRKIKTAIKNIFNNQKTLAFA